MEGGGGVFIVLYPELAQSTSNLVSFVLKETVFNDDEKKERERERDIERSGSMEEEREAISIEAPWRGLQCD